MPTLSESFAQSVTRDALKAYLMEFIATFFFTVAVIGSMMSSRKLTVEAAPDPASLTTIAMATAFGLSGAIYISAGVSGGHVNPAVTFAMAVGGRVSVPTALFYWISQMLASIFACLVLTYYTASERIPIFMIQEEMTGFAASVMEGVMTFELVYTVFVMMVGDVSHMRGFGPLVVGLVAGANVLASGPFAGGSMNPACAFGAAVVAKRFRNQAVYWIGPLIGAGIAVLLYDGVLGPAPREVEILEQHLSV